MIGISEAAKILGRSVKTLQRWDDAGDGPHCIRVNGQRRYKLSVVLYFADHGMNPD